MNPTDPSREPVDLRPTPETSIPGEPGSEEAATQPFTDETARTDTLPPTSTTLLPPPAPRIPFWSFSDLALFAGLCIVSLLISALLVRAAAAPFRAPLTIQLLLTQAVWYFLSFGALAALFRIRYFEPFWESLGWRRISVATTVGVILLGPVLTIVLGIINVALRSPDIAPPFEQMLGSTVNVVLLGLLAVVLGPLCEELAFRGFLMPLLMRGLGAAGGIILTGVIFGSAHGYQYQWSWQYMLLISLVGCAFGWAKHKTQSTVASTLMHSTFNLTQFAGLLLHSRTL
jgi:membrane protease YdiL (CAAX protease family)